MQELNEMPLLGVCLLRLERGGTSSGTNPARPCPSNFFILLIHLGEERRVRRSCSKTDYLYLAMATITSSFLLPVSGLLATYVFLRFLLAFTHDPKEPPALATEIPFLSPLLGMRKKKKFYIELRYV